MKEPAPPTPTDLAMARMTLRTSRHVAAQLRANNDPYLEHYLARLLSAAEILAAVEGGDSTAILYRELEL